MCLQLLTDSGGTKLYSYSQLFCPFFADYMGE